MKPWTAHSFARVHWKLLACFSLYLTSVVLFFVAFGVGINPINALVLLNSGGDAPESPTEPSIESSPSTQEEPEFEQPSSPPPERSAIKKIGIALGIVWWLIGMGAPIVGALSFFGLLIGVWENQLYFVRVAILTNMKQCGVYTVVFLTAFWSIACAVQVYLQRSINKRSPAIAINLISLVLGLSSMLATVVCVFFMKNPSPIEEPDYDLSIITRDEDQKGLLYSDAVHYSQGHVEDEEVVLDETVD